MERGQCNRLFGRCTLISLQDITMQFRIAKMFNDNCIIVLFISFFFIFFEVHKCVETFKNKSNALNP